MSGIRPTVIAFFIIIQGDHDDGFADKDSDDHHDDDFSDNDDNGDQDKYDYGDCDDDVYR